MENQVCNRCVLDTTVPEIVFNSDGVCQYCSIYDEMDKKYPINKQLFNLYINKIKKDGKNKKYDCIVGVSGGTDSSYTLYLAKQNNLRPLAVHFDCGWNSKVAVENIKKLCKKLDVDLFTYVVNWEEFKELQKSFLFASTPDADIPTDIGILGTLFRTAKKERIKYILNGHSFRTEGIAPIGWTYYDGYYLKKIQKKFGKKKLKTFPNFTIYDFVKYNFIKKIKVIQILNYIEYSKKNAKELLKKEFDWKDSGGHHHECVYTHFFQSYYLPEKFNIDKRKTEFSAKILSKQITRKEALLYINNNTYPKDLEVIKYTKNKLEISEADFNNIMKNKVKSFMDYPSYVSLFKTFKFFIKLMYKLKLIPDIVYLKYKNIL